MAHALAAISKFVTAIAPSAGGAGTMTAIAVDCAGFDRACYELNLGVATATAVIDMKITECATSGGSYDDITGAALVQVTKAAGDSKVECIDVKVNPAKPFQKAVVVTTNAAFPNSVTAHLYQGSGYRPVTVTPQVVIV